MDVDIIVIGGGIAGLSAAAFLAERADVVLLEAETTLGYHATGRSAAMYTECYGNASIRRLAMASKTYLVDRDEPLGIERPVLFVAPDDEPDAIGATFDEFRPGVPSLRIVSAQESHEICDALDTSRISGGVLEPHAMELDVHGIEMSYRQTALAGGASIRTDRRVETISTVDRRWRVTAGDTTWEAPVVVNAAGAWGDEIASSAGVAPLGLTPLRRSAFIFDPHRPARDWPLVVDTSEQWYFKPEGPNVLGSAANEIPSDPVDARPDELDIALGIDRINAATDFGIRSIASSWAGLRTFTPDRTPAVGFDPAHEGFFWLVGQGGYGIKTSPALAAITAGLVLDGQLPDEVARHGVTPRDLDPARFRS